MDLRLALMCGTDLPIEECGLIAHQPSMREIAMIGESEFFEALQCLTIDKAQFSDKSVSESMSNFQIFMTVVNDEQFLDKKKIVLSLLSILFPTYKIMITPRSLVAMGGQNSITVDDQNFDSLQKMLKVMFCMEKLFAKGEDFNPVGDKAKQIAEKLKKGRQKVAELKNESNASIFTQYISILTVGLNSMSLDECTRLTVFQILDLIERYNLYVSQDLDIKSRLAGATPDQKPENWMKNIH